MEYLTPEEFADRLPRITAWSIRRKLAAGKIPGHKIGGRWFIPADALGAFLRSTSNQPQDVA